jgi:hypothetical protein
MLRTANVTKVSAVVARAASVAREPDEAILCHVRGRPRLESTRARAHWSVPALVQGGARRQPVPAHEGSAASPGLHVGSARHAGGQQLCALRSRSGGVHGHLRARERPRQRSRVPDHGHESRRKEVSAGGAGARAETQARIHRAGVKVTAAGTAQPLKVRRPRKRTCRLSMRLARLLLMRIAILTT